ncbi:hypothetical protein [Hymenobacter elongatus]|uniref:Uncharacterized protein n=1 Tax=Hymenobacter elongatus TaxID=877208 RepID=A0A4Z0PMH5_9BACT|nr:hypothetical protein [Hymenobacter elongatus]TGE16798.1 hypothetical protein E5J99_08795 [Hymenobacter elongatus]
MLPRHDVAFETNSGRPAFDVTCANHETSTHFVVKLHPQDFEIVRGLEEAQNQQLIGQVSPDHYLFTFTDEELIDVLLKPNEWNGFAVTLARQILQDRGKLISSEAVLLLRKQRTADRQVLAYSASDRVHGLRIMVLGVVMVVVLVCFRIYSAT